MVLDWGANSAFSDYMTDTHIQKVLKPQPNCLFAALTQDEINADAVVDYQGNEDTALRNHIASNM